MKPSGHEYMVALDRHRKEWARTHPRAPEPERVWYGPGGAGLKRAGTLAEVIGLRPSPTQPPRPPTKKALKLRARKARARERRKMLRSISDIGKKIDAALAEIDRKTPSEGFALLAIEEGRAYATPGWSGPAREALESLGVVIVDEPALSGTSVSAVAVRSPKLADMLPLIPNTMPLDGDALIDHRWRMR